MPSDLAVSARKAKLILGALALLVPASLWAQGIFAPGVNYPIPVSGGAFGIAVGDVNGDKIPDVVVAGGGAEVGILLGNGDGTFQPETNIIVPLGFCDATAVALGDFNGDGSLDLAVLCQTVNTAPSGGAIEIYLNNGNGTFQAPVEYAIDGITPTAIFAVNFRNNGKLDLAILNQGSSSVTVLLGNGDGTFATPADYGLPSGTVVVGSNAMTIGDVNGDGRPDVALAGSTGNDGTVTVLLTNTDGTLGAGTNWVTTTSAVCAQLCVGPKTVAIVDINNDGKPDLVADVGLGQGLVALLGNGDGTFQAALPSDLGWSIPGITSETGMPSFATRDFNSDGKQDLVEAMFFDITQFYDLAVYLGNGDGTFQSPTYLKEGITFSPVETGPIVSEDLNGDGLPDLVMVTRPGGGGTPAVTVILNCGLRCTNTNLTSSASPSVFNQQVTFTATVSPVSSKATETPTGTVLLLDINGTNLGTASLTSGSATFMVSAFSVGSHGVIASYQGDANFAPSTTAIPQTVNRAPTAISLSSSPNPSNSGQSVIFTAVVSPATSGVPTGNVVFADNGAQTVSVPLDATGSATFSVSSLTTGTHTITWAYSGDGNFIASTSAPLTQIVGSSSSPMAISSSATSATVGAGQSASFTLAITPLTGFNSSNSISFSCSGLPALASCSFSPSTLTTKGSVVTTKLTITTTGSHSGSTALGPFGTNVLAAGSLFAAALVFLPFSRKSKKLASLLSLVCLASLAMLLVVSCGGGSSMTTTPPPTTPAGTYTVAVTATAGSGSQTQNLNLTVTP